MITRFPGLTPTRSRAVATDDLVFTVAVAPDPCHAGLLRADREGAGAHRREPRAVRHGQEQDPLGDHLHHDVKQKNELNRAWDEWVDTENPPMRACIGVDIEPPHLVEIVVTAAK